MFPCLLEALDVQPPPVYSAGFFKFFIVMSRFSLFSLMLRERLYCHCLNAYNIANPIKDSDMAACG